MWIDRLTNPPLPGHGLNINLLHRIKMCEGPDLNRGTPARTDLESVAFDRAWLPSRFGRIRLG